MSPADPRRPGDLKAPGDHVAKLHLYADRKGRRRSWLRRLPQIVFALVVLSVGAWAYRSFVRSPRVAPEAPTTEVPEGTATTVPATRTYRNGLTPLPDSELAGPVGTSVLLTTRAMGPRGRPLVDTLVSFRITAGSGALTPDSVRTDTEGLARTALQLPGRPERVVVVAELPDSSLPGASFAVTARAGAPTRVAMVSGNGQEAPVGAVLPRRLGVRVTDAGGNPVFGVEVRFRVVAGGGIVAPSRSRTDSTGSALAVWRLGTTPGEQRVAVLAPEAGDALLTFTATATGTGPDAAAPGVVSAQPAEPDLPEPVIVSSRSFTMGGNFVCSVSGGGVSCRGANDRGQRVRVTSAGFTSIAAGVSHACALTEAGEASCWGANDSGQLGDGSRTDRAAPVSVTTDVLFGSLTAGLSHTCGLAGGGQAYCWGKNVSGQLGNGSREDSPTPRPVSGGQRFVSLTAGWNHTCARTAAGETYCWGLNDHGQLGEGSRLDRLTPTPLALIFQSLAAGSVHTCGIRDGDVMCWGDNGYGQLGDGTTQSHTVPVQVRGLPGDAIRVAAGAVSACALLEDGRVYCWGQNRNGQLGDGTRADSATPVVVAGQLRFRSIYAAGALTCGFTTDGAQYCWGLNQSGQLGDGTRVSRAEPTRVGG